RARVQVLGLAVDAFAQGVAYFHAGVDILRSKSLDRNSFNSGDWFNRVDWRYQTNYFGSGLPPQADNGKDWAAMKPLLANAAIKPPARGCPWTRCVWRRAWPTSAPPRRPSTRPAAHSAFRRGRPWCSWKTEAHPHGQQQRRGRAQPAEPVAAAVVRRVDMACC